MNGLEHQHGRRLIVLEHQYGRRDVMRKRPITVRRYRIATTCTAISRKVVGKSARDNPERHCGWF